MSQQRMCGYWLTGTTQCKKPAELIDGLVWRCQARHAIRDGYKWTKRLEYPVPVRHVDPGIFDGFRGRAASARGSDPDTSHAAAASVDANAREGEVLASMGRLGGSATTGEISEESGVDRVTVSPRMKPLEDKGLVARLLHRRDGQTVWRLL